MDASDRDFLNTLDQELQSGEFVELEKVWATEPAEPKPRISWEQLIEKLAEMLMQTEYDYVTAIYNRVASRLDAPEVDNIWDEGSDEEYWVECDE